MNRPIVDGMITTSSDISLTSEADPSKPHPRQQHLMANDLAAVRLRPDLEIEMRMFGILALGLLTTVSALPSHASGETRVLSDEQWSDDLHQLSASIKEIHFKPFHVFPEAEFDAAIIELGSQIPRLSDADIIVTMAKIVAKLGDGHTRLHIPRLYPELALPAELGHSGTKPPKIESLRFRQSPVRFELFHDGLFVVGARPEYQHLLEQEVVYFDETPVDRAIELAKSVSFHENDSRAKLMVPDRLALPEVTENLGISVSSDVVAITTVDASGRTSQTHLQTLNGPGDQFVSSGPTSPLWLRNKDKYRWYEILDDRDAIFVQVNEFEENPVLPYGDFVATTIAAARDAGVSRFVIDLRHNFGGNGAWVTPFVTGLGSSEFNQYGRLYILMGRSTFSAAQFFLHKFEELSYAIFVGEQSGAKPSHFGDARRVVLDNSGLTLRVSTIYWHSWLANDFRDAINPHISAPLTSTDFFAGHDAVLEAALRYKEPGNLALQMDEQFRQEKNQNALLLYQRYMSDARFSNHQRVVPDLLKMADQLVEDSIIRPGYFVYFLANMSFPGNPEIESGLERIEALLE